MSLSYNLNVLICRFLLKTTQMFGATSYKTKQFFLVLIKLSIVVAAFYFIYHKLCSNQNLELSVFIDFLSKNELFSLKTGIFLILLTGFNWFFEILKWQTLVSFISKISFYDALEQSLGSLTASLFTPNRVGEYGAKIMYFPKKMRKKVALMNLISHGLQMTITTVLGLIGFVFFIQKYNPDIDYLKIFLFLGIIVLLIVIIFLVLKKNVFVIRGFSLKKIIIYLKNLPFSVYTKGFGLSVLRYAVFSFQFYFLLYLFGVEMDYLNAMTVITSMYLLASIIPSIFIFDVVIKGSVAVYLFDIVGVNDLTTLSIITIMWLLNFVLPSTIGAVFVMAFKLPETNL